MKFGSWDKWTSTVTKFGAVGSILFLALELHQNSQQLEAQSRYTQFEYNLMIRIAYSMRMQTWRAFY